MAAADRRDRAVPDGGKLTSFPPVVRWPAAAVVTLQDVRVDAERWGGGWRGGCFSWRELGRGAGFVHGFVNYYGWFFLARPKTAVMAGSYSR